MWARPNSSFQYTPANCSSQAIPPTVSNQNRSFVESRRQAAPRAIPTAPASRSHPKGVLRRRPHGRFFSNAITAPSSSIQIRLPVPTRNITAISDQQQPTQNKPCSTPMRSACADSFPPCQREVIKDSGERHLSRQAYFSEENW